MSTSKDVVLRYLNAIAAGDMPTMWDSFAPDATWTLIGDLPMSGTWTGPKGILEDFLGYATQQIEPDSLRVELTNILADGDQVVAEWHSTGSTKRGDTYDQHCAGIFTVRDGKIQSVREYFDTDHARSVLFPAEAAAAR